jgi:hypothetical protein
MTVTKNSPSIACSPALISSRTNFWQTQVGVRGLVWSYTVSRQPWCQCFKQNQQIETYDWYIYSKHITRLLQILGLWLGLYSC